MLFHNNWEAYLNLILINYKMDKTIINDFYLHFLFNRPIMMYLLKIRLNQHIYKVKYNIISGKTTIIWFLYFLIYFFSHYIHSYSYLS